VTLIRADTLVDTVGNPIKVGITANFPDYVDSVDLMFFTSDGNEEIDTILKNLVLLKNQDTLWYKTTFATNGNRTLIATAFVEGNNKYSIKGYLNILDKPVKPVLRAWPHLVVNKTINIATSQTCSLAVSVLDSNPAQAHTFYMKQDTQPQTIFTPPFRWTPPAGFIDTSVVFFKVTDTDSPAYFDTATVSITVTATPVNHAPKWTDKAINEVTSPGNAINLTLSAMCKDTDNDPLTFSLLAGAPSNDSIANAATTPKYTFMPGPGDTGTFYPKIVASDSRGGYDTLTITLNIHAQIVTTVDSLPPVTTLLSPAHDSTNVSSNTLTIKISCTDNSGVANVKCFFGADSFTVAKSDSNRYSANITGLKPGVFNSISFTATDSSSRVNKATLTVHIKYDSTMTDATGPVITKVSGLANGSRTGNANDTLVYSVTDASGVDTVSWTLNGTPSGVLTADGSGHYSINTSLTVPHTNKIVLIAYDKSTNHNKSTDTTIVNFNRPPVISGAHDTTIQELSTIQFTLMVTDPDNDNKTLSAPTLPTGATFNATTGAFAWSPTSSQTGANTVVFKANDGLDTATRSISIVVSNMPPPVIATSTGDQTKCIGSPVSFSVTVSGTVTYQWKNDAGNLTEGHYIGTKTATLTINSVVVGDASTYSCIVTNAAGSVATSPGANLTVNTLSSAPSTVNPSPSSICLGGSSTLTETGGTLGSSAVWKWYTDTNATTLSTTGASISVSPTATTTYWVRAEGACGNSVFKSVTVTFNAASTSPSGATANPTTVCTGGSSNLSVTGGSLGTGAAWKWYTDTTAAALATMGSPISVSPTANTTYYVRAEGTCGKTAFKSVAVAVYPSLSVASIMLSANPVCAGASNVGISISVTGGSNIHYAWTTPHQMVGDIGQFAIATVSAQDAGSYSCVITDDCHSGSSAITKTASLTVNAAPTVTNPLPQTVLINNSASFSVTGGGSGTISYQWQKDGSPISGANSFTYTIPTVLPSDKGNYACVITTGCGSITSNPATLTVQCIVTFDGQGGTVSSGPKNVTVGLSVGTLPTVSGLSGCNFYGWGTGANYSGSTFNSNTVANANITVYAQWTMSDAEGHAYKVAKIGDQFWMAENLKATKYNDGITQIPLVGDFQAWVDLTSPGYCWYITGDDTYGPLYNWYIVDPANSNKIAPTGWHVSNETDWNNLQTFLIANGFNWDNTTNGNKIAKSMAAKTLWLSSTTDGAIGNDLTTNNRSGFSALPAGFRDNYGQFMFLGQSDCWWSTIDVDASSAYYHSISNSTDYLDKFTHNKHFGYSVRLVRD
jgi:uncharacterized protein (TIGR02145 family)